MRNMTVEDVRRLKELMDVVEDMTIGTYRVLFGEDGNPLGFVIHNDNGVVFVPRG